MSAQEKRESDEEITRLYGKTLKIYTRAERRKLIALKELPNFSRCGTYTVAVDEHCNEWEAPGEVDLSPFGFSDNVEWAKKSRRYH
ncbi:MAG TPA: hypothetical protein VIJ88_01395 [Candidatus Paceibacterota bacterium]